MEKKRVYQVAKEFHISSEALMSMLHDLKLSVKSHMSVVDESMYESIQKQFKKQQDEAAKDIQKQQKISEAITKKSVEVVEEKKPVEKQKKSKKRKESPTEQKAPALDFELDDTFFKERLAKKDKKIRQKIRKQKKMLYLAEVQDSLKKTMASLESKTKGKKVRTKQSDQEVIEEDQLTVKVSEFVSVAELATQMGIPVNEIVSKSMEMGQMVSINQRLDMDTIVLLAHEFGFEVEQIGEYAEDVLKARFEESESLKKVHRPPIVTVMGHVDHGKTSLLDYIRKSNIIARESGGITQHIGSYSVTFPTGDKITFIDTPGHEAFTAMRARGAKVTDIVILVIAADDGVMPQTLEAIDHAKAAGVPIIIAINKIDLPNADPEKVRSQLSRNNILVEDWGGKFQCQEISAKKGTNVDKLLEKVLLEAEMLELKANPDKEASGVVIDAKLDRGRGPVATVLIQSGTLNAGDPFIAGMVTGRVRAMQDEHGQLKQTIGPAEPVQVFGMDGIPRAGDTFYVVDSEIEAREIASHRRLLKREQDFRRLKRITLSDIYDKIKEGLMKEINLIIKSDVDGSLEAIADSLSKITHEEVRVKIIHQGVGGINENDVLLAAASNAIIIGFHVRPNLTARALAESENVEIKLYEIIYEVIDDIQNAMKGMLSPRVTEQIIGTAEIRDIFRIPKAGTVAGCYVLNGTIRRNAKARLVRDSIEIYSGTISSLKRFKEDVSEVNQGYECGLSIEGYTDIKVGDTIEVVEMVEEAATL